MAYGLMQSGSRTKGEAMQGLSDAARLEQQREQTNDSLASAKDASEKTAMGSGAVAGAMVGSAMAGGGAAAGASAGATAGSVVPGLGTVIGAGIGLLAGWALS